MHKLRNDIILIASVLCIAGICILLFYLLNPKDNLVAYIYSDNQLIMMVDLDHEEEVVVNGAVGEVKIQVSPDGVAVVFSDCEDKICLHQGKISRANQTITCLPNKVYIRLVGNKEGADVVL